MSWLAHDNPHSKILEVYQVLSNILILLIRINTQYRKTIFQLYTGIRDYSRETIDTAAAKFHNFTGLYPQSNHPSDQSEECTNRNCQHLHIDQSK